MGDWKNLTESGIDLQGATNIVTWKPWMVLEKNKIKASKPIPAQTMGASE